MRCRREWERGGRKKKRKEMSKQQRRREERTWRQVNNGEEGEDFDDFG